MTPDSNTYKNAMQKSAYFGWLQQIMRLAQTTKIWAKEERVLSNMMLIKNGQWEIDQHYRRL